jgi:hypothetical protein
VINIFLSPLLDQWAPDLNGSTCIGVHLCH